MVTIDRNIDQTTFKLRDGLRIMIWESYRLFSGYELNQAYVLCGIFWNKHFSRQMDYFALLEYANSLGFSVEEILEIRKKYYLGE